MVILEGNLGNIHLTDSEQNFLNKLNPSPHASIDFINAPNKSISSIKLKGVSAELYNFIAKSKDKTNNPDVMSDLINAAEIFKKLHPDNYQDLVKVSYSIKGNDKRHTL